MSSTILWNKYPPNTDFGDNAVLNIGCGYCKLYGKRVVNVDAYDNCSPDIVWDLNKTPMPFQDESFDLILANHIMEHVDKFWELFCDCARLLKPNGRMEIYVPAPGSDAIWGFRDHVHEINANSFFGCFQTFRAGGNAWADANSESYANRLKLVGRKTVLEDYWWLHRWPLSKLQGFFYKHLRNVARETGYIFRKVTEQEFQSHKEMHERRRDHQPVPVLSLP